MWNRKNNKKIERKRKEKRGKEKMKKKKSEKGEEATWISCTLQYTSENNSSREREENKIEIKEN